MRAHVNPVLVLKITPQCVELMEKLTLTCVKLDASKIIREDKMLFENIRPFPSQQI